nr:MAG TPA: hypothetical protein [Caudoviricetes sp.]
MPYGAFVYFFAYLIMLGIFVLLRFGFNASV